MRTGFIDDLRNCKQCGSLEHKNNLRDDLCPNCYYDVGRFKEEREKAKADNKWLNKWQKLKEWVKLQIDGLNEQLTDYDFDSDCRELSIENFEIMLQQMQELEVEDEQG